MLALRAVDFLASINHGRDARVYRFRRHFAVRGLSARFGEELALMLTRNDSCNFAQFLIAEIRHRPAREVEEIERDET